MKTIHHIVILTGIACALPVRADGVASADYTIAADAVNTGGTTLAGTDYSMAASAGGIGGTSGEATTGYLAKNGFAGQLYDATGVAASAATTTVNEGATLQLGAALVMDDGTLVPLAATEAAWSVVGGPISGISAAGLATAATVYQDTPATVQAACKGFAGTLNLTVLNVNNDDFGIYAGDGLPDDWQVQYFGLNNPMAAPGVDADGTGQTNLFKYVSGLNPTDPSSAFRVSVRPVAGQPSWMQITFGPVLADRTYTVLSSASLTAGSWTPLAGAPQSDDGQQRTVTDTSATATAKFYQVRIGKP